MPQPTRGIFPLLFLPAIHQQAHNQRFFPSNMQVSQHHVSSAHVLCFIRCSFGAPAPSAAARHACNVCVRTTPISFPSSPRLPSTPTLSQHRHHMLLSRFAPAPTLGAILSARALRPHPHLVREAPPLCPAIPCCPPHHPPESGWAAGGSNAHSLLLCAAPTPCHACSLSAAWQAL